MPNDWRGLVCDGVNCARLGNRGDPFNNMLDGNVSAHAESVFKEVSEF
jgi:hypothetical protein